MAGEGEVGDKGLEDVYLLDLSAPDAAPRALVTGFRAAFEFAGSDAGQLYFLTTLQAAHGRIVAIDPQHAQENDWRSVVPEGGDAIELGAGSVTVVAHRLLVHSIHDAHSQVRFYGLDGRDGGTLALPGLGTASGFTGHPTDHETFYAFADVTRPPTVYRFDFVSGQSEVFRRPQLTYNPEDFAEQQLFYPARDGTRVPVLLAYRKGTGLKARNPLLLTGYGGFGISYLPRFDPSVIAWMEHGGVFATANIRGGGEYGESWHRQAIRTHKQVVFNDFIDAAEWLIAENYTSTPRLAIIGRSNGGLLVGACLTQRPELFGAAVPAVGVLDVALQPLRSGCRLGG
jgi:prolyl oligopeptidase